MRNRNEECLKLSDDFYSPNVTHMHNTYNQFYTSNLNLSSVQHMHKMSNVSIAMSLDFEDFLNTIGELYAKDPLKLELSLNFWIADNEINANGSLTCPKPSQKQISLYKFVKYFLSNDTLISSLYIAYINMLTGLCTGELSAEHCFVLLQSNSHFYESQVTKISWTHIFYAYERYFDFYKTGIQGAPSFQAPSNHMGYNNPSSAAMLSQPMKFTKGITQQELQGLISVTKLVNQIAFHSEKSRMALCEFHRGSNEYTSNFNASLNVSATDSSVYSLPSLMFGLVSSSIPTQLKGEFLNLLSSLALSPQIATNIWQLLESSQIIPTIGPCQRMQQQNPAAFIKNDISVEIEEIEARDEHYPLLRGFLTLINNLLKVSNIPDNLGLGVRTQSCPLGFQPYLQFLVNSVYLKAFYRSYKDVSEKWQILIHMMHIFHSIVLKYEPKKEDFESSWSQGAESDWMSTGYKSQSQSPGFRLIHEMIHDSSIVRMLFLILNESLMHLMEFNHNNNPLIEQCSLMCLKTVCVLLEKQKVFVEHMKMGNLNVENAGIEKLITSINPKSNRAEYFTSILRFIQFNSSLVQHSFYAFKIVCLLSNYSIVSGQFLNLFLKSCMSANEQFELVNSFVEFLEYDSASDTCQEKQIAESVKLDESFDECLPSIESTASRSEDTQFAQVKSMGRLMVLKFILYYLRMPAPNIAHLLLGFDIQKSLKNQSFFNPGTKINYAISDKKYFLGENETEILSIVPRNCLFSIIKILNEFAKNPSLAFRMGTSINCSYEILHNLCSNLQFNHQLLNYLRNEFDFVNTHLKSIPFNVVDETFSIQEQAMRHERTRVLQDNSNFNLNSSEHLNFSLKHENQRIECMDKSAVANPTGIMRTQGFYSQYAWILNLTCIEIQNLIASRAKKQLKKTINLMFEAISSQSTAAYTGRDASRIFSNSSFDTFVFGNESELDHKKSFHTFEHDLTSSAEHLGGEKKTSKSGELIGNNCRLFSLINAVNLSQPTPQPLNLNYFDQNLIEKVIESCKFYPDLYISGVEIYDLKKIRKILHNEIKEAGVNISKGELLSELKYILSNVNERNDFHLSFLSKKKFLESFQMFIECLIILMPTDVFSLNYRFKFISSLASKLFQLLTPDDLVVELTYSVSSMLFTMISSLRQVVVALKKKELLNNLAMSSAQQQASFGLYNLPELFKKIVEYLLDSSLSNLKVRTYLYGTVLNFLIMYDDVANLEEIMIDNNTQNKFLPLIKPEEKMQIVKTLNVNSNRLLKLICSDSCEGLNITTLVGLSLLTKLIEMDDLEKWATFISDKGYISCIINSILSTDNQLLEECFYAQTKSDKIIYLFETKMAFLITLSKGKYGSQLLIKHGIINVLSTCSIFSLRVKFDKNVYSNRNATHLIELLHQYYKIFLPVLNLLISISNSLGQENVETKSHISKFVIAHNETFLHILSSKINDTQMLEELKLVTNLLCKVAPIDEFDGQNISSNFSTEYNSFFARVHKEFLNLITHFMMPNNLKQLKKEIEHHYQVKTFASKAINSLCVDITLNICTYCTNIIKPSQLSTPMLLFSPRIDVEKLHSYSPEHTRLGARELKIGLVISYLMYAIDNLDKANELKQELLFKNENVADMNELEKKQIVEDYETFERMSEDERYSQLKSQLRDLIRQCTNNMRNYMSIIDKCLLLLWRHIEYYLTHYDPSMMRMHSQRQTANEQLGLESEVSRDEFNKFRIELISSLNTNYINKILSVVQKVDGDEFFNVIIKRIQRLIHLHDC